MKKKKWKKRRASARHKTKNSFETVLVILANLIGSLGVTFIISIIIPWDQEPPFLTYVFIFVGVYISVLLIFRMSNEQIVDIEHLMHKMAMERKRKRFL